MRTGESMDIKIFLRKLLEGDLEEDFVIKYLKHNYAKGITPVELADAVKVLREYSVPFKNHVQKSIDTCGTGGDGKCSMNVSSAVAVVLASLGIHVVKHGNHSHSSLLGSADIFKLLNIPIGLIGGDAQEFYSKHNFIFLYAPLYQPAMSKVKRIRQIIGGPTIFNLVGPLLNPARPSHQIVGVSNRKNLKLYADALKLLNTGQYIVYTSADSFDEVSTSAPTECIEIINGISRSFYINPEEFFEPFAMPVIKSVDDGQNAFLSVFNGFAEKLIDLVAINASLGLHLLENISLKEAFQICREELKSGRAYEKLLGLKEYEVKEA